MRLFDKIRLYFKLRKIKQQIKACRQNILKGDKAMRDLQLRIEDVPDV